MTRYSFQARFEKKSSLKDIFSTKLSAEIGKNMKFSICCGFVEMK